MALLTDLGIRGNGREILQPMLKNRFRVEFVGMGDSEVLTLQAVKAERPKLSFAPVTLHRYNSIAYVPGKHAFETIDITFESDIGGGVAQALRDQLEAQQRIIGGQGAPLLPASSSGGKFKFVTRILQLDGDDTVFEKWELQGCFLEKVTWDDLDYSQSDVIHIVTTIRFDHAQQWITGSDESAVIKG